MASMGQKYLVVSDNHGNMSNLEYVIERFRGKIEALIHCGDMEIPPEMLEELAGCPVYMAEGNCDYNFSRDKKTGKIEEMVAAHDVGKAVNPLSCEGQIEGGVVMSIGFALREHYPIDENCKPIDKYGSLGLFRSHEIPKIDAIVIDKPGLNVACGAIGIGEITSIPTAPAIADAYFRWNGERQYSLPLTGTPYERKC